MIIFKKSYSQEQVVPLFYCGPKGYDGTGWLEQREAEALGSNLFPSRGRGKEIQA